MFIVLIYMYGTTCTCACISSQRDEFEELMALRVQAYWRKRHGQLPAHILRVAKRYCSRRGGFYKKKVRKTVMEKVPKKGCLSRTKYREVEVEEVVEVEVEVEPGPGGGGWYGEEDGSAKLERLRREGVESERARKAVEKAAEQRYELMNG